MKLHPRSTVQDRLVVSARYDTCVLIEYRQSCPRPAAVRLIHQDAGIPRQAAYRELVPEASAGRLLSLERGILLAAKCDLSFGGSQRHRYLATWR